MNEAYGSDLPCEECGTCECIAKNDGVALQSMAHPEGSGVAGDINPDSLETISCEDGRCPGLFEGTAPFWVGFVGFMAVALWWVLRG